MAGVMGQFSLSEQAEAELAERYAHGEQLADLAGEYGCSKRTARRIVQRHPEAFDLIDAGLTCFVAYRDGWPIGTAFSASGLADELGLQRATIWEAMQRGRNDPDAKGALVVFVHTMPAEGGPQS